MKNLPCSAVVPSAGRFERLLQTVESLRRQELTVSEIVVVGANMPDDAEFRISRVLEGSGIVLKYERSIVAGAAVQRNRAVVLASQSTLLFVDDDVDLEPGCIAGLWNLLQGNSEIGGVNAHITNQNYHEPGRSMRLILALVGCGKVGSLAGKCCGPALNFLPDRLNAGSSLSEVDWLNLTCTMYRREVLPSPVFPAFFFGYSLMEDCALSLFVARRWKLATASASRIFHDTRPAEYKANVYRRERMEVVNRFFVLTTVMKKVGLRNLLQFWLYQLFSWLIALRTVNGWRNLPSASLGRLSAIHEILIRSKAWERFPE